MLTLISRRPPLSFRGRPGPGRFFGAGTLGGGVLPPPNLGFVGVFFICTAPFAESVSRRWPRTGDLDAAGPRVSPSRPPPSARTPAGRSASSGGVGPIRLLTDRPVGERIWPRP